MIKFHAIFPQIMLLCVCFWFVRCRSALFLFREDEGVVPIDGHEVGCHDAPDDGLTEDDRIVPKLRDEQHDEDDLAHQLDDAGEERQHLVAKALQGVAGGEQDAQHRVERCVPEQDSLYIVKETEMARQYTDGEIKIGTVDDYVKRTATFLAYLSKDIVIQRLVGRAPEEDTLFCNYGMSWWKIKEEIEKYMEDNGLYQGIHCDYLNGKALRKFL